LAWILRHGAKSEGLAVRPDGYIRVTDLLANQRLQGLDFPVLQEIIKKDAKKRYDLLFEATSDATGAETGVWWVRANQGHSIKTVQLELQPVLSSADIAMAVHGTTLHAWQSISTQGLSKMSRNHIHLAQGIAGGNIVSGMRNSSQIYIYIDIELAISAGIKFFLSVNGVVLTAGDERGFLPPQFFSRVEDVQRGALPGWEGKPSSQSD
jgi:2'-phosphotransferase